MPTPLPYTAAPTPPVSRKPDPAPLHAAFAALGAHPQQPRGLYVGDSEFDANCARNAGVPLILFMGGYRHGPVASLPHHAQFDDFSTLPALVAETMDKLIA